MKKLAALALGIVSVPATALACKGGPDTMARIEAAERNGHILLAITAGIVLAFGLLVPRIRRRPLLRHLDLVAIVIVHPGLWMGARRGDCGMMLSMLGPIATALTPVACALIYWAWRPREGL